jgi:predicted PurR-regulated permease PerM
MIEQSNSERLLILQRQLQIFVLGIVAVLLLYQVCSFFSDILRIFGISVLFSYLFIGIVDWLQKYVPSRALAVMVVYAAVIVVITFTGLLVVPAIMSQISQLLSTTYDQLPVWVENITKLLQPVQQRLNAAQIQIKTIDILNGAVASVPHIEAGQIFSRVSDVALSTMTWTLYGLSILVVSFYFLLDGYRMKNAIISVFPIRHDPFLHRLASEIDQNLQSFFRVQILLGLGFGAFMVIIFTVLGIQYALLSGFILGIWEIVPVIGSTIGIIPAIMAVAVDGMDTVPTNRFTQLLILLVIFQGLQWVKDNVIAPRYIGNVIGLHPVLIFIAIMVGARIDGLLGIIFAIPVACVVNVLAHQFFREQAAEQIADSNALESAAKSAPETANE